jgi:hypothetical protein
MKEDEKLQGTDREIRQVLKLRFFKARPILELQEEFKRRTRDEN